MSKMYNIYQSTRFSPDDFKNKEIDRWMSMYTGCVILRSSYKTEEDLERDWDIYTQMSYELKVLSNNQALRLFGKKNEDMYNKLKKHFLRKDIDNSDIITNAYSPKQSINESIDFEKANNVARDFSSKTGYGMILADVRDKDELNRMWFNYQSMPIEKKRKADAMSIQLFGIGNADHYHKQLDTILRQDIKDTDVTSDTSSYAPSIISYITAVRSVINASTDMVECAKLMEIVSSIENPTIVEQTLQKSLIESMEEKVNIVNGDGNYLGSTTPYFLPQEMEELGVYTENNNFYSNTPDNKRISLSENSIGSDGWFANYEARCIGLKPQMSTYYSGWTNEVIRLMEELKQLTDEQEIYNKKQSILELGWNPLVPFTQENRKKAANRTNTILKENIGYNFVDIHDMMSGHNAMPLLNTDRTSYGIADIDGVIVLFVSSLVKDPETINTKVFITTDTSLEKIYPLSDGEIQGTITYDELKLKFCNNFFMKMYYLRLSKDLSLKLANNVHYISKNRVRFGYSFLQNICNRLKSSCPDIANEKLFCIHVMNMALSIAKADMTNPANIFLLPTLSNLRNDTKRKDNIYIIFDGSYLYYNSENVRNNILKLQNTNLNESTIAKSEKLSFLKPYLAIIPVQEVTTLPIDFDNDGNLFIKRKETLEFAAEYSKCHKLLLQYSRVKNYEAMKYYVSKLWYMNILIEKKIHYPKKPQELKDKLPYFYKTRAHILNDFNKYMAEILDNEPSFDFKEYYKTTPFDKSTLKVSNTLMRTVWNLLSKLLTALKLKP